MIRVVAAAAAFVLAGNLAAASDVERFTVEGPGSVNTFIVPVEGGVVIIDAQRSLSLGQRVLERVGDREVLAVLLTHPHPDHVGGLATIVEATGAPVHASEGTARELEEDANRLLALTHEIMPDDSVPADELPAVDRIVAAAEPLTFGDVRFVPYELGPSESLSMTLYALPAQEAIFAGDLFSPGMTPFLLERRTAAWLETLARVEMLWPADTTVYPGHGDPGPLSEMVADQRAYLTTIRSAVGDAIADGALDEDEIAGVVTVMEELFGTRPPVAELPNLAERNVRAVAAELSGTAPAPPVSTID